ncbi:serine hydrolase [Pontibacter sp. H259]|uniref:serine hydrolase domain-containing protein n=1 Tax=Pontibacter sp. H259 TaxID=3133421 RepID=UPI0030BADCE6
MKKTYLGLYFLFLSYQLFGQQKDLTAQLESINYQKALPGFAVAIVTPDSIMYAKGFGFADVALKKPFTDQTILNIGSVSKTFIGVALAKAIQDGQLSLDDDINKYLPFKVVHPYYPETAITVRHLVTHTSGILDREKEYEKAYIKQVQDSVEINPFLEAYLSKKGRTYSKKNFGKYKPGTKQAYSNIGSTLAALVLEGATKQSFNAYTQQHIFEPLNSQNTNWFFKDVELSRHAILYTSKQKVVPLYTLLTYPDGGLKSDLADLSLYLQEMLKGYNGTGKVLTNEAYSLLFQPQFTDSFTPVGINPKEPNIGLFWVHRSNGELGHTGSDPGVSTFMFFNPVTRKGRIFITNTQLDEAEQVQVFTQIWKLLGEY